MKPFVLFLLCSPVFGAGTEDALRALLQAKTGTVRLPPGVVEISREIVVPVAAHDLEIDGHASTIKASAAFRGRALLVVPGGRNIRISGLSLDGSRDANDRMTLVPPAPQLISRTVGGNGFLIEGVTGLTLSSIKAAHLTGFGVVIASSRDVKLHDIEITESGGYDPQRHNNGAGGIALEDGVANFEVTGSRFGGIRGTGLTIRAGRDGRVSDNEFAVIARDGIHASASSRLDIEGNRARQIGAPTEEISGSAVCIRFDYVNDSVVKSNGCEQTLLGAMVVSGSRNAITGNRFLHLNLAAKNEGGITLASPAAGNTIDGNEISGTGMSKHCVEIATPLPKTANKVLRNDCSDEASVADLRPHKIGEP